MENGKADRLVWRWISANIGRLLIVVPFGCRWWDIFLLQIINPWFGLNLVVVAVPPDIMRTADVPIPAIVIADAGVFRRACFLPAGAASIDRGTGTATDGVSELWRVGCLVESHTSQPLSIAGGRRHYRREGLVMVPRLYGLSANSSLAAQGLVTLVANSE